MKKQLLVLSAFALSALSYAQSNCTPTVYNGTATYYVLLDNAATNDPTGFAGNCTFVNQDVMPYYGAAYTGIYNTADQCGVCLEVTGVKGTQIIQIADQCPTCHVNGDIDLSQAAFDKIVGAQSIGASPISWFEVSCPWGNTPISVQTQGSNEWYGKVIIFKHINRIKKVEFFTGGNWVALTRTADNGWAGSLDGVAKHNVRVTDIFDEQVVVSDVDFTAGSGNAVFAGTSNFKACLSTDITSIEVNRNITFYPNPSTNQVVFDDVQGVNKIELYNAVGELVKVESYFGTASRVQLDMSALAAGTYIVKLNTAEKMVFSSVLVKM
ncbi:MAG: expansin EXLX1 family cellulose-binding protein [Flavobacteriales bacterium]